MGHGEAIHNRPPGKHGLGSRFTCTSTGWPMWHCVISSGKISLALQEQTPRPCPHSSAPPNSLFLGRRPPPARLTPSPRAATFRCPPSITLPAVNFLSPRTETSTGQTLDESPPSFACLFSPIPPLLLLPNPPPLHVRRAGAVSSQSCASASLCSSFSCCQKRTAKSVRE
jgi:hypothetical protein